MSDQPNQLPRKLFEPESQHKLFLRCKRPCHHVYHATDMGKASRLERMKRACKFRATRKQLEYEWRLFHRHAEKNFQDNFAKSFWPGWFELRVSRATRSSGYRNRADGGGPDFELNDSSNNTIFVEATVLTAGTAGNSAIPTFDIPQENGEAIFLEVSDEIWARNDDGSMKLDTSGKPYKVPNPNAQNNLTLRITNAIASKKKQYNKWLQANLVGNNIPFVLAISAASLDVQSNRWLTRNEFERALYGKGNQVIEFSKTTGKPIPTPTREFSAEDTMQNQGGSDIDLALFLRDEYRFLSAIWWFEDSLFEDKRQTVFINPHANVKLPQDFTNDCTVVEYSSGEISTNG
jgi:hypothetical protein